MWLAEKQRTLKPFPKNTWCGVSLARRFQVNICPGKQVLVLQSSWGRGHQATSQPVHLEMLHQGPAASREGGGLILYQGFFWSWWEEV